MLLAQIPKSSAEVMLFMEIYLHEKNKPENRSKKEKLAIKWHHIQWSVALQRFSNVFRILPNQCSFVQCLGDLKLYRKQQGKQIDILVNKIILWHGICCSCIISVVVISIQLKMKRCKWDDKRLFMSVFVRILLFISSVFTKYIPVVST